LREKETERQSLVEKGGWLAGNQCTSRFVERTSVKVSCKCKALSSIPSTLKKEEEEEEESNYIF
jgi:hypothetical protein